VPSLRTAKGNKMSYLSLDWGFTASSDIEKNNVAVISGWTATAWQEEEKDWSFYSKAWHRSHGSKVTITGRFVRFTSPTGKKVKTVELDGWRGNWQVRALLAAGLVKPKKGQMHARLNEAFDIKIVEKRRGYKLYERTLKGEHVDYCLVSPLGVTYHAESFTECLKGLKQKRRAQQRKAVATISWDFCRGLGFCKEGIKEFCSAFGFSLSEAYTPQEIYEAIASAPAKAAPFESELRTLASVVGFEIPASL
jgi:hypothetical protein